MKSIIAYIIYLEPNSISWSCKKHKIVAKSSIEAEYRTIGSTTTKSSRMKHIAIDYHFVRDLVNKKELNVSHVPSSHQLVDLLTKIGVTSSITILRGCVDVIS
uniref:Copia protein n=1 Tax=Cajanus cajan TaxID=3821 RepID=A0A151UBS9_CAJCA|nr:hypothetical protein KK1_021029 [Cajanus cajan]